MLKSTRTILALTASSLVLGLVGAGTAVAEDGGFRIAGHTTGKVVSKGPLKVRSKPTTHSRAVGELRPHGKVEIRCKKRGESVDGNNLWYRLAERDDKKENGDSEHAKPENGNSEHGDWQIGKPEHAKPEHAKPENGRKDHSDWQHGTRPDDRKAYEEERWVSARYVENHGWVQYCR
ncbi:hypothetical protein ACFXB3_38715 [Streptomyces sp. NPDC059447]|uniref:hypothetical protein n=1 Tax=Streptomyces sp. NPDC059447 TaxID=3346834 RepID=UPI0036C984F4